MKQTTVVATLALLVVPASAARAQDFSWRGQVARGQALEIRGLNGEIRASRSSGNQVRVTAVMEEGRRGNMDDVTVEVVERDGGVTICAMYPPGEGGRENRCGPGDQYHMNTKDNDTRVRFTVEVPAGIVFIPHTVNGDITADDLDAEVSAHTVNGDIDVSSGRQVDATTVNGSIDATIAGGSLDRGASFKTVNGGIVLRIRGEANADVTATTVNGSLETDFPLTVSGRWGPKRINGTIGRGGPTLKLSTVNGGIEIRKR